MIRYYSCHDRWGCTGPCTWIYSWWSLHYVVCGFYTNYPKVSEVGSVEFTVLINIYLYICMLYIVNIPRLKVVKVKRGYPCFKLKPYAKFHPKLGV